MERDAEHSMEQGLYGVTKGHIGVYRRREKKVEIRFTRFRLRVVGGIVKIPKSLTMISKDPHGPLIILIYPLTCLGALYCEKRL